MIDDKDFDDVITLQGNHFVIVTPTNVIAGSISEMDITAIQTFNYPKNASYSVSVIRNLVVSSRPDWFANHISLPLSGCPYYPSPASEFHCIFHNQVQHRERDQQYGLHGWKHNLECCLSKAYSHLARYRPYAIQVLT